MEYYYFAGGAVYDRSISAVGGVEGLAEEEDGEGCCYGKGERSLWERGRGHSCWGDDAVGRFEDEADVGEGEGESWDAACEYFEGVRAEGFVRGNGS